MWSTTALFLELQRLYRAKSDADIASVQLRVASNLRALGRSPDSIPAESVRLFSAQCRCPEVSSLASSSCCRKLFVHTRGSGNPKPLHPKPEGPPTPLLQPACEAATQILKL